MASYTHLGIDEPNFVGPIQPELPIFEPGLLLKKSEVPSMLQAVYGEDSAARVSITVTSDKTAVITINPGPNVTLELGPTVKPSDDEGPKDESD